MDDRVRSDGYYQFYPGDYLRDTLGLSMVEDGAYRRLLDSYYSEEYLPSDKEELYRIARAMNPSERTAVDKVVGKYFNVNGQLLIKERVERQIQARRAFIEGQSRKGKQSGEARKANRGSTRVQPGINPGSTGVPTEGATEREPKGNQASASALASRSIDQKQVRGGTKKLFRPPTLAEVSEYCKERKNKIDPEMFIDKNTAIGWVVGRNRAPMRDWRATIRTWEKMGVETKTGDRKCEFRDCTYPVEGQHGHRWLCSVHMPR